MFERVRAYLKNSNSSTHANQENISASQTPALPRANTSTPCKKNTWVYIWNLQSQGVGHAAIQVGGCHPKMEESDPGEYVSIHPKSLPSAGPLTVLPLPAELATTLKTDMESEANAKNNLDTGFTGEQLVAKEPDCIYQINNLDTDAMNAYIEKTKRAVKRNETAYQLFPNVDTLGFLRDSAAYVNHDPIDIEIHNRSLSKAQLMTTQRQNCSTLVRDILEVGGMPINRSNMPWGISPTELGDEIAKGFKR